jgi:uncharacterized membrane protein YhhN
MTAEYQGPRATVYVCKPLTMAFIIALALTGDCSPYALTLALGLVASVAGDAFLMLPADRFLLGLTSFLVAHFIYIFAFLGLGVTPNLTAAALILGLAAAAYALLLPGLGRLRVWVALYVLALASMQWLALSWWLGAGGWRAGYAAIGASLFLVSDTLLGANRFRWPFRASRAMVLGTYFTAQWLLALSARSAIAD